MPEQDPREPGGRTPAPRPVEKVRQPAPRRRDLAEATGYVAGRTVTGLTRMLLRNKTVRQTLRNLRDANREPD